MKSLRNIPSEAIMPMIVGMIAVSIFLLDVALSWYKLSSSCSAFLSLPQQHLCNYLEIGQAISWWGWLGLVVGYAGFIGFGVRLLAAGTANT